MAIRLTKYEKKPVEKWLNETDYQFKGYMPSDEAIMFVNFIKEVNNGEEENETPLVHLKMMDNVFTTDKRCAILCHRGIGKLGSPKSGVLTPSGWSTMEKIRVGDEVVTRNGKSAKVSYKTPLQNPKMYEVELSDGTKFEVGDEHNHIVWMYRKKDREKVLTTKELLTRPLYKENTGRVSTNEPKRAYTYSIPLVAPIEYEYKTLPHDPYVFGLMLSDGYFKGGSISCHLDDMIETGREVSSKGYKVNCMKVTSPNGGKLFLQRNKFKEYHGWVFNKKHIPHEYLFSSIEQRTELLRGLMDGDGSLSANGSSKYHSYNKQLAKDVRDLARSLGAISYLKEYVRRDKKGETEYQVIVNIKINPFKLKRKANSWKPTKKTSRAIVGIKEIGDIGGYCIQVDDESHSYLTDGYTVTHNTTVFAEYLILYIAAFGKFPGFGKVNLLLYITDSIENGVKNLRRNVEFRYANSDFLQKLIPNRKITMGSDGGGFVNPDEYDKQSGAGRKFTDIRLEFKNHKGHTTIVKGYGAKTGVRGAKEMGQRPSVAILDDLVSDTDAESPTIINTIENTVYKAVSKALNPMKQKMVWLGTPFNAKDPLYKAVESGAWNVSVYPICEEFPVSEEDFRGSWEDRFTYEYVRDEYEEAQALGKPANFNQELMLRIMSAEDRLVQDGDIVWYDRSSVLTSKSKFNFYITTDFATSEKSSADFSVISVWAYNSNGDWLWVDGVCKRQLMDQNIHDLFRLVQMYKPQSVGIEITGQQGGFIQWIREQMIQRNVYFNLASNPGSSQEGIRPNTNKMVRFNTVLPLFKSKKIWLPEDMKDTEIIREAIDELSNASKGAFKSKHDDWIDTVSMLSVMDAWKPSGEEVIDVEVLDSGVWSSDVVDDDAGDSYDVV